MPGCVECAGGSRRCSVRPSAPTACAGCAGWGWLVPVCKSGSWQWPTISAHLASAQRCACLRGARTASAKQRERPPRDRLRAFTDQRRPANLKSGQSGSKQQPLSFPRTGLIIRQCHRHQLDGTPLKQASGPLIGSTVPQLGTVHHGRGSKHQLPSDLPVARSGDPAKAGSHIRAAKLRHPAGHDGNARQHRVTRLVLERHPGLPAVALRGRRHATPR